MFGNTLQLEAWAAIVRKIIDSKKYPTNRVIHIQALRYLILVTFRFLNKNNIQ